MILKPTTPFLSCAVATMFFWASFGVLPSVFGQVPDSLPNDSNTIAKEAQLLGVIIPAIRATDRMPVTQTTLDIEALRTGYAGQDMPFLLARTPSVITYGDAGNFGNYVYFRLRGLDPTRINFTINGLPLGEPEDQGTYFSNFTDFVASAQSVQVQRGVGTSTNGVAAYAGSVNIEALQPAKAPAGMELQGSYGSFNTHRLSAVYNTGFLPKSNMAVHARMSMTGSDGYRRHSGHRSRSGLINALWLHPSGRHTLRFLGFVGNAQNEMAYLAVNRSDLERDPRTNYLTEDEKDDFTQDLAAITYEQKLHPAWRQSATIFTQGTRGNYDLLAAPDLLNLRLKGRLWGGMLNASYSEQAWDLHLGLYGTTYYRDHLMWIKPLAAQQLYDNTGYKNEASAFAKLHYHWNGWTPMLDLQARWTSFRYAFDAAQVFPDRSKSWLFFNPKLGLHYQAQGWQVYASFGKTSREPTRTDLLGAYDNIDSSNIDQVGDFGRVKPETVYDLELGGGMSGQKWMVKANAFLMLFRNEIAAIGQLNFFGLPLRKNVERSLRTGLELEASWQIHPTLRLEQHLAYCYSRIQSYTTDYDSMRYENVTPLLTPAIISQTSLQYQPWPFLAIGLQARYVSQSFLDNTNDDRYILPSYWVMDARLTWMPSERHQLELLLNNLANRPYYSAEYVGSGGEAAYFVQAPLHFNCTYRWRIY